MNRYAAVVLAAGQGSRYRASGGAEPTKLVALFESVPLVRRVVVAAVRSTACPVVVVTGHAREAVEAALSGVSVLFAHNDRYAEGLAGSLRAGVAVVPSGHAGAVVLLGDMPMVTPDLIDRLVTVAAAEPGADAVVPVSAGRRGNPVVLSRRLFPALARLEGDAGARHLLRQPGVGVREVAVDHEAATLDIDEAADLLRPR